MNAGAASEQALIGLPNELLVEILELIDLISLFNAELVSPQWQSIASTATLWRKHIQQYFPLLEQEQPAAFQANPRNLFISELAPHIARVKDLPDYTDIKPFILEALRGNFDNILNPELELPKSAIDMLYRIAAANGHPHAIMFRYLLIRFISPSELKSGNANQLALGQLVMASTRGEIDTIDQAQIAHQGLAPKLQSFANKRTLYVLAAICGHEGALSHLNEEDKSEALLAAAQISSHRSFEMIFTKANIEFTVVTKKRALMLAIVSDQLHILQSCFRLQLQLATDPTDPIYGDPIDPMDMLSKALDRHQGHIVDYLWTQLHHQLTFENKNGLLKFAGIYLYPHPDLLLKFLGFLADEIPQDPRYQHPTLTDLFLMALNRLTLSTPSITGKIVNQLGLLLTDHNILAYGMMLMVSKKHEQFILLPEISRAFTVKMLTALRAGKATRFAEGKTEAIPMLDSAIALCEEALIEREMVSAAALVPQFAQMRLSEAAQNSEGPPEGISSARKGNHSSLK